MAHLFKNKKIKEALESYEIPDLEGKIAKVKSWYDSYENKSLHTKTESQCEQAFNQHFFIEILEYVSFPNETYTIDPKGTADASSQKADAVLGYFGDGGEKRVTAVVEIKDVNTSLERSQQRAGNMSPIQQAFKYKPQYKDCAFVIATNFFEIRLFRDDQLDYESFTLETLTDPKDNYYEFRKFYYLLNSENFVIRHGKSVTEKLLAEIRIEQEKITKSFYKDYKDLRQSLINNLVKNSKGLDFDTVVEKAQKVIDRIVFVCFCEDLDLIPENKLQEVVFHTEKLGLEIPVWDIMKGFFKAIDKGSKKLEIPNGYNGELFKEDPVLDGLFVDDAICKRFVELGKYDFSEDLTVNILGHIFEQSVSDIEELKSFVEEKEIDKKKSKRKKDGIFYTPDYIVDYIVKNSLGAYLEEKEKELMKKHGLKEDIKGRNYEKRALKVFQEYQDFLENIKVLDPACGSGAFLVKVFDYLLAENKRVADVIADLSGNESLFSEEDYIKDLLENNIYGVDLNPESVEITKLSLWLKTAMRGKKLVSLKNNIKCGNSLIDDPEVAGNRAFKWEEEFKEIMESGGFDVVVGNPPYVYAREKISEVEKSYYNEHFETSEYQLNTFVLFSEKSANLLKKNGYLGFIIPNSILKISSITKLRKFLLDNGAIKNIIQLFGHSFEGVNVETIIFVFQRAGHGNIVRCLDIYEPGELNEENYKKVNTSKWKSDSEYRFHVSIDDKTEKLLGKIKKDTVELIELFDVKAGLQAYEKGKGNPIQSADDVKERPYDFSHKFDDSTFKYLDGKNVGRYFSSWSGVWLKYGDCLAAPRVFDLFNSPRILVREITGNYPKSLICTYFEDTYLNNRSIINIVSETNNKDLLKILLLILNSSIISYYFKKTTPKSDRKMFPKIILQDLRKFPIKLPDDKKTFIQKADLMLSLNKQFYEKLQKFLKLIQSEFGIEKISKKFKKFYELDFDEFIKALKLKKLSLDKKEELLEFFEKHKKELLEVKNRINVTDKEIDEMVFDLYGLSEEEREMVGGSV